MTPTQSKHTPAPWILTKNSARLEIRISDMNSYAFSHRDEANARLIAAAPELLEACKNALVDPDDDHAREMIEKAIAKAEGTL